MYSRNSGNRTSEAISVGWRAGLGACEEVLAGFPAQMERR